MKSRYLLTALLIFGISHLVSAQTESLIGAGQVPTTTANNSHYELGTQFTVSANGYITAARLYTNASESGSHVIRLWQVTIDDYFLITGPITWNITSGTQGWREYTFTDPVSVTAGSTYIISISNGSDYYYMYAPTFSTSASNTNIHYVSGVYTATEGFIPMRTTNGNCYFRDIIFTTGEVNTFFGGTIGSAQTVCYNTAPTTLTQTVAPARGSAFQWQNSTDGLLWSDIPGETSSSYSPPVLTTNTYYRREVTDGVDVSYSNSVLITVNPRFTLAQLYENVSIASGGTASFTVELTGGSAPYTISYSVNGVPQAPVTSYENGTKISTGVLTTGSYVYSLTSVTDFYGCAPESLGPNITVTVTSAGPDYTELESLFGAEQIPAETLHDRLYELGSEFQALADGYLTKARLYSSASEGGNHTVRLWRVDGSRYTVLYGPYTWNITSGTQGWREYTFPEPVRVESGGTYVITISNSSDYYYTRSLNFTSTANGQYINYTRGVYAKVAGGIPYRSGSGLCFFRDVVFAVTDDNTALKPGTIGAAQTICYNTVPATLTQITVPSGGSSSYTYQWQSSSDANTWTNISGATSATYSPAALTSNTYFRRGVISGAEGPIYSNTVLITVHSLFASAQLHDNVTIPNNSSTTFNVVITGGTAPYIINYTRNGVAQTAITGYTGGTAISTGSLTTGSYTYALTSVTDANGCSPASLGSAISINVTSGSSTYMELESLFGPEQIPAEALHDRYYEHGSEFQVFANGYLTKARLYSNIHEAGDHIIRLWRVNGSSYTVVSGPYTWNFSAGVEGWREFTFPQPIPVQSGNTYVIVITNGPDFYYTRSLNFTSTANNQYIRYTRGCYAKVVNGPPYRSGSGLCFFRDVVFAFNSPTPGTIAGPATPSCSDYTPLTITEVAAPTEGTGIYTYQWQSSSNGTTWSDIAGATSSTYAPPLLPSSTYFRREVTSGNFDPVYSNVVLLESFPGITQAQMNSNVTIDNNASTTFNVTITGGQSPYTVNYTRNGTPQTAITGYTSGSAISTGTLTTGQYIYAMTSVTDAHGCTLSSPASSITVTVLNNTTYHYNFTYPDRASMIADGWDFMATGPYPDLVPRNTEQTSGAMVSYDQVAHPGVIRIPADIGGIWTTDNNSRNTLFRDLPTDWSSIRVKVKSFNPTENYQSVSIAVYQNDNNYLELARCYNDNNKIMVTAEAVGVAATDWTLPETATSNLYFRFDRDATSERITFYYSLNGTTWIPVGSEIHSVSLAYPHTPRLAILTGGSSSGFPNADIEWAEIRTNGGDELRAFPRDLVFNSTLGQTITATKPIFVVSELDRPLPWTASTDVQWLTTSVQSGTTESQLRVGVNATGLGVGVHTGNITIQSYLSTSSPVTIPVKVIINPVTPVTGADWYNGYSGAMSVSVDNGDATAFTELVNNGFIGTYVSNYGTPPVYYTQYFNAGMELGSHLYDHECIIYTDSLFRANEIVPNLLGLVTNTPATYADLITLVYPCGTQNYRMQGTASDYFLSGRGYNFNKLEDPTPENMMNLKSYNTHGHVPNPPANLITVVDSAITLKKWFNLVLHESLLDDGAITYAKNKDIWVTSIGKVVKYIYQRERLIISNYSTTTNSITFGASRISVPSSSQRTFENSFGSTDLITLQVDYDDIRLIESVTVNGVPVTYTTKTIGGNHYLYVNVLAEPANTKTVVINYVDESIPRIILSEGALSFNAVEGVNPLNQTFTISSNLPALLNWTATVNAGASEWLSVSPASGTGNATVTVSVNVDSYTSGTYSGTITVAAAGASNSPQTKNVTLTITPSGYLHLDFTYADRDAFIANGWDFIAYTNAGVPRNTEQTSGAVVSFDQVAHPGVIRIPVDQGELWMENNSTRNSLFRDLPDTWESIRMKVASYNPVSNYQAISLVAYQDDDHYMEVSRGYNNGNSAAFVIENGLIYPTSYTISNSSTTNFYLRLDRDPETEIMTAFISANNSTWTQIGTPTAQTLTNPRLGVITGGSYSGYPDANVEWIEVLYTEGLKSSLARASSGSDNDSELDEKPAQNMLYQNYPNPFENETWIEYDLSEDGRVIMELFNSSGQKLETIMNENLSAGKYWLNFVAKDEYPKGVYYLTMKTRTQLKSIKIVIVN